MMESAIWPNQINRYPKPCRTTKEVKLQNLKDRSFPSKISSRSHKISSMTRSSTSSKKVLRPLAKILATECQRLLSTSSSKSKFYLSLSIKTRRQIPKAWSTLTSSWSRLSTFRIRSCIMRSKQSRPFWPSSMRQCLMSWGTPSTL